MGIFIAAAISTALGIWFFRSLLRRVAKVDRELLIIFGFALPLSPIVNIAVKRPILEHVRSVWGLGASPSLWPWWFALVALGVVGVSEESIKLLPLAWRPARARAVERSEVVALAMAIGLAFGIGEAWFIGWAIHRTQPQIGQLPFYKLTGFIGERLLAMVLHTILVSLPISGFLLSRGRVAQRSVAAMGLHCVVDFGPMLYQCGYISPVPTLAILLLTVLPLLRRSVSYLDPLLQKGRKEALEAGTVMFLRSDREKGRSAPPN